MKDNDNLQVAIYEFVVMCVYTKKQKNREDIIPNTVSLPEGNAKKEQGGCSC